MDIVQQTEQDLRARQIALEEESLTLGIDHYQKERHRQEEADSGPGRRLIRDPIAPLSQAIDSFVAEAPQRQARKEAHRRPLG